MMWYDMISYDMFKNKILLLHTVRVAAENTLNRRFKLLNF